MELPVLARANPSGFALKWRSRDPVAVRTHQIAGVRPSLPTSGPRELYCVFGSVRGVASDGSRTARVSRVSLGGVMASCPMAGRVFGQPVSCGLYACSSSGMVGTCAQAFQVHDATPV